MRLIQFLMLAAACLAFALMLVASIITLRWRL